MLAQSFLKPYSHPSVEGNNQHADHYPSVAETAPGLLIFIDLSSLLAYRPRV
jgi:hypothetical protein